MRWEDFDPGTMFWGKLNRPDKALPPVAWHPLGDHCVDVASCAEALLTRTLLGNRLAVLGGQESLHPGQVARLCVLAGLHDVGKYNHGFQAKDGRGGWVSGHVSEGLTIVDALSYRGPKMFCRRVCAALQVSELSGWSADGGATIINLLVASVCHHGRIVSSDHKAAYRFDVSGERDPVGGIGELLSRLLVMFPDALGTDVPPLPPAPAFQHAFMGLMVLADWLGSDTRSFPYSELGDAPREDVARAAAARVLRETWLDADRSALGGQAPSFSAVAGARTARPVQQAVGDLGAAAGPSCVVLEAETGSGKTEAALVRFFALLAAGEVDGMFFALPTRASARQIYLRVLESVRRVFSASGELPPVILAVPGYLNADGVIGKRGETPEGLPSFDVLWPDEPAGQRRWAAENSKRFLSGAVVVGTVDQALLGVLDVNHGHLRATSLLRQLLVVDEVHASDEYMTELLAELLRHHRDAGGHAMVMSATCGGEARARLLGDAVPTLAEAVAVPYPRVECRAGTEVRTSAFNVISSKTVHWDVRAVPELPAVVEEAVEAARGGARVVILRNTVSGALEAQGMLEATAPSDLLFKCRGVPTLHHGRYAVGDRYALDDALERRFEETGGFVVVSTQTLEQSLDIDADLLVTDLCPADVLIQRVGRLHRHARSRPEGFTRARCVLLAPSPGELHEAASIRTRLPCGWGKVYEDLDVLELTRRLVTSKPVRSFPRESREFVESALHSEARRALLAEGSSWSNHVKDRLSASWKSRRLAELSRADWDIPVGKTRPRDDDAPRRLTRLGDGQDRLLRLRESQCSPFLGAPHVRWLTLPHWAQVPQDQEEIVPDPREPGRFEFTVGDDLWSYSRTGLQLAPTNPSWREINQRLQGRP